MGKRKRKEQLLQYLIKIRQVMRSHESVTSHAFSSLLFHLGINPDDLMPQTGTRKGQIDYVFMPESDRELNFFIELKKYEIIDRERPHEAQLKGYLAEGFPEVLKDLRELMAGELVFLLICIRHFCICAKREAECRP